MSDATCGTILVWSPRTPWSPRYVDADSATVRTVRRPPRGPEAMTEWQIQKYGVWVSASREVLIDAGALQPTPAERAKREAAIAAHRVKAREAWHVYADATRALDNLTDPAVRAVLSLHGPDADGIVVTCRHCYTDTEMGDRTEWPCETVEAIARAYGIDLPATTLYRT